MSDAPEAEKASPLNGLPEPARILVITLRRLGDVLLTTPLIRTVRRGFPHASLDVLVFRGGERILAGNPDINDVVVMSERPAAAETWALVRRLWRRYDLVISTQTGDRPTFFALIAGRRRVGLVPPPGETGAWWKRLVYQAPITPMADSHRMSHLQQLADALRSPVRPRAGLPARVASHSFGPPRALRGAACQSGLPLQALDRPGLARACPRSSRPGPHCRGDRRPGCGRTRLSRRIVGSGRCRRWCGSTGSSTGRNSPRFWRGAAVYVGVDTSMTHLAAGAGCPTIALYGPTSPRLIGPWPVGGLSRAWDPTGTIQRRGNVWVVQNPLPCLPCEKLGCDGHLDSRSQCLDELPVRQVLAAVDQALGRRREAPAQVSGFFGPSESSSGP